MKMTADQVRVRVRVWGCFKRNFNADGIGALCAELDQIDVKLAAVLRVMLGREPLPTFDQCMAAVDRYFAAERAQKGTTK
jgi:hypothetical protein